FRRGRSSFCGMSDDETCGLEVRHDLASRPLLLVEANRARGDGLALGILGQYGELHAIAKTIGAAAAEHHVLTDRRRYRRHRIAARAVESITRHGAEAPGDS